MAGSGPMSFFSADLGMPVVCAGSLWWHDARAHAPNESIRLEDYRATIQIIDHIIDHIIDQFPFSRIASSGDCVRRENQR